MGKPNDVKKNPIGLFGVAALAVAVVLLFGGVIITNTTTNAVYATQAGMYLEGDAAFTSIPNNQIVKNPDDTSTIVSEDEASTEEDNTEVGHQVDQDLDCPDYFAQGQQNFNASTVDEGYKLDGDNDGIACEVETAPNGTEVVTDPGKTIDETETGSETTTTQSPFQAVIAELNIAIVAYDNGDVPDTINHIQQAIQLLPQVAVEPQPPESGPIIGGNESYNPATQNETNNETIVTIPEPNPQFPVGTVQGNAIFVDALNLESLDLFNKCPCLYDSLLQASVVFYIGQLIEANPDQAEAIVANNQTIAEEVANNPDLIGDITGPIVAAGPDIASNQTSLEEVIETEVVPAVQDSLDMITVTDAGEVTAENTS